MFHTDRCAMRGENEIATILLTGRVYQHKSCFGLVMTTTARLYSDDDDGFSTQSGLHGNLAIVERRR